MTTVQLLLLMAAFHPACADEPGSTSRTDVDRPQNVVDDAAQPLVRKQRQRHQTAELIRSNDPKRAVPGYESRSVNGWPVRISEKLLKEQPEDTATAIRLLNEQLTTVARLIPPQILKQLQDVPIWLSPEYPGVRPTGEYHPGADWLRSAGRRPELVECIELTNISIMEREVRRMPMLILHELAHAYHHQVLNFENAEIKAAYDQAAAAGIYESVQRGNGRKERAYAITNHKEYFAESTEAFFGTNDFYPFNRSELKEHDPRMHDLLIKIWQTE